MAREANIKIDIDVKSAATSAEIKKAISGIFGSKEIKDSILRNVCKLCSPRMSKAANKYISRYVLPKITKHPNIDFTKPENVDYRGALGIPKRFNYQKLRRYFNKAYYLNVTACGSSGTSISFVEAKIKEIAEASYRYTSFKTGGRKRVSKRFWLKEADLGVTDVASGFQVFPGPGETLEDLGPSESGSFGKYSRSGTHIMIPGGYYDPNEWRPEPEAEGIIESTFKKYLPNIERAALRAVPPCIKQVKRNLALAIQRAQKSLQSKAKTIGGLGSGAPGSDASYDARSSNQQKTAGFDTEVDDLANKVANVSFEEQLQTVSKFTGAGVERLRVQIIQSAKISGVSPSDYLNNLIKTLK